MSETEGKSLEQKVDEIRSEPVTAKDKVIGVVIAVLFIALCVGVWAKPDLISLDTSEFSGRGGRTIARILNIIWSRPAGTIAGIVGLLVGWGALTKKVGELPSTPKTED